MRHRRWLNTCLGSAPLLIGILSAAISGTTTAAEDAGYKVVSGLAVYLGVLPAEMIKGHQAMHGGAPKGAHQYHVLAAIFDSASGDRISDATVTAQVSPLGLSGPQRQLEPMQIAGTITYGGFFNLPGPDLYTVRLTIERPGIPRAIAVDFQYDHRR